jgi:hypothetical protein
VNTEGDGDGVSSIVVLREQDARQRQWVTSLLRPRHGDATPSSLPSRFRIFELALGRIDTASLYQRLHPCLDPIHGPLLSIYSTVNP